MPKILLAALLLAGALPFASLAQDSRARVDGPSKATVTAGSSQPLKAGQEFVFLLQFDQAPQGYGGGTIQYEFRREPVPGWGGFARHGAVGSFSGKTELHDGQSIYSFSIPITDSMAPGPWTGRFSFGAGVQTRVSIWPPPSFVVSEPETAIHFHPPEKVQAGQPYVIGVNVDEYPRADLPEGCILSISGFLRPPAIPDSTLPGQTLADFAMDQVDLSPEKRSYELRALLPPDVPSGTSYQRRWYGELKIFSHPGPAGANRPCPPGENDGGFSFTFVVERAPGLVTPTSATVTINPSQVKLLFAAADRLKARAERLKQQIASTTVPTNQALLQEGLRNALTDLDQTEASYKQSGLDPAFTGAVNTFFDDIRLTYGEALTALANNSVKSSQAGPQLERVSAALGGPSPRIDRASQAVLSSILHNARAYQVVASSKAMTFNLDVFSEPKGAAISYRQRGGEYHALDHETDWRIENLARAVYLIRLQKPGYEDKEVTFDAIDSSSTSVDVPLAPKRGPQ